MDQQSFLDRLVAPGNYLAIAAKGSHSLYHKFFARDDVAGAARFIEWTQYNKQECWYGVASYTNAEPHPQGAYRGKRTQENAHALKCFFFDADIKRAGDRKKPEKVFATETEVLTWTKQFCAATGMPRPNLWVCSGYGLHLYWVLEQALERAAWQPYAEKLKAALIASGAKGDTSIVADAARILRPIGTSNFKVPENPVPVYEFYPDRLTKPDFPNATLLAAIDALPAVTAAPPKLGKPSAKFAGTPPMTANAKTGIDARPHYFALIADRCAQVRRSLDEAGAKDGRQIWHALITLSHFCEDGREYAHAIGRDHPEYTEADTDKEFDGVAEEHARKPFGAPLCTTLDAERPGVCDGCPLHKQGKSPYSYGVPPAEPDELPEGYQRGDNKLERYYYDKKAKEGEWLTLINGDVADPVLERVEDHLRFTFTYVEPRGVRHKIQVNNAAIEPRTAKLLFTLQGVPLSIDATPHWNRFVMAWMDQLLLSTDVSVATALPAFGWVKDGSGKPLGFSVGGTYYKTGGTTDRVVGGDRTLIERYTPHGSLEKWQEAALLITAGAPEFQVALGCAFGALLMGFTDEDCLCISFVGASGRGKSSVFRAGAAVWGNPIMTMSQLDDTANYISMQIGTVKNLPIYWDEIKVADKFKAAELKTLLHKLTQGRDRGRLTAEVQVRRAGDWTTIFPFASNDSVISALSQLTGDNAATLLRMLEIRIDNLGPITPSVRASQIVAQLKDNYGHAGRKFVEFIVSRTEKVAAVVNGYKQDLLDATRATADERFFIAGSAAILAGATIAKKLNLIDLNIPAMRMVLITAIKQARGVRNEHASTDPTIVAYQWLESFCVAHTAQRLITRSIPTSGAALRNVDQTKLVLQAPLGNPPLAYQVGVEDQVMRISSQVFRDYALRHGQSPDRLKESMEAAGWTLGRLLDGRSKLGVGTPFDTPRARVIELNLKHPDLAHYAEGYLQSTPPSGNVVPLRP